jgi:hypothetical protein
MQDWLRAGHPHACMGPGQGCQGNPHPYHRPQQGRTYGQQNKGPSEAGRRRDPGHVAPSAGNVIGGSG